MKMLTTDNHQTSDPDFCWGVEGEIANPHPHRSSATGPTVAATAPTAGMD